MKHPLRGESHIVAGRDGAPVCGPFAQWIVYLYYVRIALNRRVAGFSRGCSCACVLVLVVEIWVSRITIKIHIIMIFILGGLCVQFKFT